MMRESVWFDCCSESTLSEERQPTVLIRTVLGEGVISYCSDQDRLEWWWGCYLL